MTQNFGDRPRTRLLRLRLIVEVRPNSSAAAGGRLAVQFVWILKKYNPDSRGNNATAGRGFLRAASW